MRAVIQRVGEAQVQVDGQMAGQIGKGLLVYLSVGKADGDKDAEFMAEKLAGLRIFADDAGKMNRSVVEIGGEILLVSNFTLHGDCRKGRRPGFDAACEPELANRLYEKTAELIAGQGVKVAKGVFGAYMQVSSVNDGPVTFLVDSSRLF
ncbi:MAG: D-aminoacyl-tRNA deacylase [Sedimentisphaerales bacterium]|nr:D-aminoacyl-tRNA deacylase [Sedimentisphaerales bacterium]